MRIPLNYIMKNLLFSIDLQTLITLTTIIFFTNGILLILIFKIRNSLFLKWLQYGCFTFALGWLFFVLRFEYGINIITLPLANFLILLMPVALVFCIESFLKIAHSKVYLLTTLFVISFTFILLACTMNHKWIPGIYTSLINGIFYCIPGFLLLKKNTSKQTVIWIIAGLNIGIAILLITRALILSIGWFFPESFDESVIKKLLSGVLCFNIICVNAQVLCFPILDLMEAQKELALVNTKLTALSNIDELTGLLNRRFLGVKLNPELSYHFQNNLPFSIILFDLDHFKMINDKFGHLAGDAVLIQIAKLVNELVRETDLVIRYGGEEFIILLPETEANQAIRIAEKLRKAISKFYFSHPDLPHSLQVTASFGIANLTRNSLDASTLIKQADIALYQAKTQGRNQVCLG